jgi:hypothetical protein
MVQACNMLIRAETSQSHAMPPLPPAVLRLIEVLEEENAVLAEDRIQTHGGFTERKNQALRELMAAQRANGTESAARVARHLLERLAGALRVNTELLKLHIAAVGELSDIIVSGMREADSDGTYSRNLAGRV